LEKQRLTTFVISLANLKKRSFRTISLIVIVAIFAFSFFCGTLLLQSINLGVNNMSGRMGADIMVVPRGYETELQNTLLRSEPNTFYLDKNLAEEIYAIPGVEQVSPQLFIASLNAACCTVPVQLIGYEPKTDFTIKYWMTDTLDKELGFGEVVAGSLILAQAGDEIWFYGNPFRVVAILDKTGMGFDSSIFMTVETAQHMIEISNQTAAHPAGTGENLVSALFVKLADDANSSSVAETILSIYPETDVVLSQDIIRGISSQLSSISSLIYGVQGLLWIFAILVLVIVFTITTNERKREFGLYLALGATRKKLVSFIMAESLIVSMAGAVCGVMVACLIIFPFRTLIAISLELPYLNPTTGTITLLIVASLLISTITGVIACIYSAVRIRHSETYFMIRE
jgi:putative ABC transport system permease protein